MTGELVIDRCLCGHHGACDEGDDEVDEVHINFFVSAMIRSFRLRSTTGGKNPI